MSKGPKNLTSTNQTTVDPTLTGRQTDLWNQASTLAKQPYQPYTGDRFEGFTPDQMAAWDQARTAAGAGQGELDQAGAGLTGLKDFTPSQVNYGGSQTYTAAAGPNVSATSVAGAMAGRPGYNPLTIGASRVNAGKFTDANLSAYLNPVTNAVVDTSLSDVERARKEAIAAGEARAAGTGAWGGKRHGVSDSLTNRDYGSLAAKTSAELRSAAFDKAAGLITSDQDRVLRGDQGNQAADLQASISNQNTGLQAGLAKDRNALDALTADQRAGLEAQVANQSNASGINKFNAGQLQTGSQFDADAAMRASTANASNSIAGANTRLNSLNSLSALGSDRQRMLGTGADLLSRIGGQQQAFGQAKKDFDYQQFAEGRDHPYKNMDLLQRILASGQYGSTNTSTTPNPNRGSFLGSALGLGGLLAGGPLGGMIGKKLGLGGVPRVAPEEMGYN